MNYSNSPLRTLVKTYANGLIDRKEYIEVRAHLLKQLESQGHVSEQDLEQLLKINEGSVEGSGPERRYSNSDWILILLGLLAAGALGFILFG